MPLQRVNITSLSDVETRLKKLAVKYGEAQDCFDRTIGKLMTEFDFLKWSLLIQQRDALVEQSAARSEEKINLQAFASMAPRIYGRSGMSTQNLTNRLDESGLRELAA